MLHRGSHVIVPGESRRLKSKESHAAVSARAQNLKGREEEAGRRAGCARVASD